MDLFRLGLESENDIKSSTPTNVENQLMGAVLTIEGEPGPYGNRSSRDIGIYSLTKLEHLLDGKLTPGTIEQLTKGMFIKFTTYSDAQGPTWLVFSNTKIPSTIHDPRIAE
jgi:hypothetical protein